MTGAIVTVAVDGIVVDPQGLKEAVAMALEPFGWARVTQVQIMEPEQMGIAGVARTPPKPKPAPPAPRGQAPARNPARRSPPAMECCYSCARYYSHPGMGPDGKQYWGICGNTGRPVYELKDRCAAWARLGT